MQRGQYTVGVEARLIRPRVYRSSLKLFLISDLFRFNMGVDFPKIVPPQNKASPHCPILQCIISYVLMSDGMQ